jgi:predicted esterase
MLDQADAAMLMVHGRGARAEDILSLADQFAQAEFAYLAPQAAGNTWYPNRFLVPLAENEPWLSSALEFVGDVLQQIITAGIPYERTILLGFSQGACLALEFAARNARRLAGTPVFLGCSDMDFHVPKERVDETAEVMRNLGGDVTERLYPNLDHTVNRDEIDFVRGMMSSLLAKSS